jgi:flagellar basal-body rod protein FlgC
MYGTLDISTSGMIAQRIRLETIAANIANKDVMVDENGKVAPYRRRIPLMAAGDPSAKTADARALGVHITAIEEDDAPFDLKWDPSSPYAYKTGPSAGYVPSSNVSTVIEQINAVEAARAYEANVAAAEVTKSMTAQALRLLA